MSWIDAGTAEIALFDSHGKKQVPDTATNQLHRTTMAAGLKSEFDLPLLVAVANVVQPSFYFPSCSPSDSCSLSFPVPYGITGSHCLSVSIVPLA